MTDTKTISDFGDQWTRFTDNSGFHASVELLEDHLHPLMSVDVLAGKKVAEIGSGEGRIAKMLLETGATVTALEPSDAFYVLCRNVPEATHVHARGEELPLQDYDFVFSIGVLHHIPDPDPVVKRAYAALKPGGKMIIWLYAREGNESYLRLALPLRAITRRAPDSVLMALSHLAVLGLYPYVKLCEYVRLPMRKYMNDYFKKLPYKKRILTVFDQLNPSYAKYYTHAEAISLLERNGFHDVRSHHRHGYSWTVVGLRE